MIKGKQIKYQITGPFGMLDKGKIINALLLQESIDNNIGLVLHPKTKEECPSLEFCIKHSSKHGVWVSVHNNNFGYINIDKKCQDKLVGKRFKWKRKFYDI